MELSSDPYELKLFQMFQSCDKENCGLLDKEALHRLCGLLELQDRSDVLEADLVGVGKGVSFERFKEALLKFLGTETELGDGQQHAVVVTTGQNATTQGERSLVLSDDHQQQSFAESPPDSSSEREVSPKLIVGSKKYGRRSRPQALGMDEYSLSDLDDGDINETDGEHRRCKSINHCGNFVQRSCSQTDIPGNRRRRPHMANENKLKRCSSLPSQKGLQGQFKTTKSRAQQTNTETQQPLSSSLESIGPPLLHESLPLHSIVDIWERSNIANARGILLALGFEDEDEEINLSQLNKVLEEEFRNLEDDPQATMFRAALALQSTELTALRQTLRQIHDENAKLRADNKDANHRLAMLAIEIDERHASLEDSSKKEMRLLEQRHAAVVRDLTTRMAKDRENWNTYTSRLESKIKAFEQEEIKMKTELELIRKENSDLEADQRKLQKQITELLEKNIELNREIADFEDNAEHDVHRRIGGDKSSDDEVSYLVDKISTLQMENKNLRDKNDELVAEVESLNFEVNRAKVKNKKTAVSSLDGDGNTSEEGANATATKRRGDSPSKSQITEESPRLGKLRKCTDDPGKGDNSDTSGEWIALNKELRCSNTNADAVEEIDKLKQKISELEEELKVVKESSASATEERCKELEASLEQMQRAYEDCEDYWQSKLSEERQMFEEERQIYEDEQQESNKKFTELMEKVREYEEQFSKDGRLSPIEEKDILEQQYTDLEAEAEELRENARKLFEEKSKEIEALQKEIEDLRMRLGESVEILTGAQELNAEVIASAAGQRIADSQSPANSPINYLWHQSTIQEPMNRSNQVLDKQASAFTALESPSRQINRSNNLSTSETTIFSTNPVETIGPIQKPRPGSKTTESETDIGECDRSSTSSGKSSENPSVTSTQSGQRSHTQVATKTSSSPSSSLIKEELKRLKCFEISLKEQIKDLCLQRDGLVMELQQLQEARPVLEKAYARTTHPNLIQRVNQLELKNRHLQNVIKQQQYTESFLQQSWRQNQMELSDLHKRIEAQGSIIAEQAQRLQNADILVKDLYVENSHLTATVQRLEQHRMRTNLVHQQHQGLSGLPGMP